MASNGIGEELRRERLRQGLTLEDVVRRTRISPRYIEAIEADAFDRLPGTVFARNFVRLYALDLKLDSDDLLTRLPRVDIESAPLPNPPARAGRNPWDPRLTAALASVLWLVTAAGAGIGAWFYFTHSRQHSFATAVVAPAPAMKTTARPPAATSPNPAQLADTVAVSTSGQGAPPEAFDNSRPVQVVLTAREAAWVQVSADGRTAFVGLLHPNDRRTIAADAQVKILTGNAGGLDISLNGKPLDPIGPSGQVRTVRLTAEGPQYGPQIPSASAPL